MISETKIDESLSKGNYLIQGFSSHYRLDHDFKGGGIMLYVKEDIYPLTVMGNGAILDRFELTTENQKSKIRTNLNFIF